MQSDAGLSGGNAAAVVTSPTAKMNGGAIHENYQPYPAQHHIC